MTLSTMIFETSEWPRTVTQDIQLGREMQECDNGDCFKVQKQYKCGCRITWTDHYHGSKRFVVSKVRRACSKVRCIYRKPHRYYGD